MPVLFCVWKMRICSVLSVALCESVGVFCVCGSHSVQSAKL